MDAGTTGIVEHPTRLHAFFDDDASPGDLTERFAAFTPEFRTELAHDYQADFEASWQSRRIGERFFLAAPWSTDLTPPGRIRLEYLPGMACGTGEHPCTQLCLQALERVVRPGDHVLDIGVGSGILSIAALLLGASTVIACDIDPGAVAVAQDAFRQRNLDVALFVGSTRALAGPAFDVILANISAATVKGLAKEFERLGRTGARVIASGFREWEPAPIDAGEVLTQDAWQCLVKYRHE